MNRKLRKTSPVKTDHLVLSTDHYSANYTIAANEGVEYDLSQCYQRMFYSLFNYFFLYI